MKSQLHERQIVECTDLVLLPIVSRALSVYGDLEGGVEWRIWRANGEAGGVVDWSAQASCKRGLESHIDGLRPFVLKHQRHMYKLYRIEEQ